MNFIKYAAALGLSLALVACGGGGGSAGTPIGGTATGGGTVVTPVSTVPTLTVALLDEAGSPTSAISVNGLTTLKANLKNANGTVIAAKVLSVTGDVGLLKFPDGNAMLTDSGGVATLKVGRASLSL
jgi:hypothetical protein